MQERDEPERSRAKTAPGLRSASVVSLNGAHVEAPVGPAPRQAGGAASDSTLNLLRTLITRLAEIPPLAASAATLSRDLEHWIRRQDEHERRANELSKEIAELKRRTDDLTKLCAEQEARLMVDSLTGCHSRYAYERRLDEEFQRWQRHLQPLTFSLWDIDLFKRVNDSYGHEAGDRLLRAVTELFAHNKRAEDFLARIGGEEFALLLPMTTLEAATTVADKLRCVVEGAEFRHRGDRVRVTMSAGLTDFRPGDTPATVYERADRALYQAKQQGRNHCVVG